MKQCTTENSLLYNNVLAVTTHCWGLLRYQWDERQMCDSLTKVHVHMKFENSVVNAEIDMTHYPKVWNSSTCTFINFWHFILTCMILFCTVGLLILASCKLSIKIFYEKFLKCILLLPKAAIFFNGFNFLPKWWKYKEVGLTTIFSVFWIMVPYVM